VRSNGAGRVLLVTARGTAAFTAVKRHDDSRARLPSARIRLDECAEGRLIPAKGDLLALKRPRIRPPRPTSEMLDEQRADRDL
jgi:hypothetical protein